MKRGKWWSLLFLALALLTIWAVVSNSRGFSFPRLVMVLKNASPGWMAAALAGMLGFICFEGMAVLCILRAFGYKRHVGRGFLYSAADIYFSAITPSATGGQPASAYFMMEDGVPGAVVAISLVANLVMHSLSLLTVGIAGFLVRPGIFFKFHLPGKILIGIGFLVLSMLAAAFCLLIAKPGILEKSGLFFLRLGKKLHLVRHEEAKREKFYRAMGEYRQCAEAMAGHRGRFGMAFVFNLLQRISQVTVTLFVYLAVGGRAELSADIWFTQSFVALGTYSVPIPGGMGVADYLLMDGFRAFMGEGEAVNLELISRGLSFYVCMIVSGFAVLAGMVGNMRKKKDRARGTAQKWSTE